MTLQSHTEHPHGFADEEFDALLTRDRPVIFAYHGYPYLIHRLTYRRTNHDNLHVHGFRKTTTPFDMAVINELDRFHLALAVMRRVPGLGARREKLTAEIRASWLPIVPMSASTARTCRRSWTGSGLPPDDAGKAPRLLLT